MAAPAFVAASTGATDATGPWSYTFTAPGAAGRFLILAVLQDGNTNAQVTLTSITNAENLAGTDNTLTKLDGPNADDSFEVGISPTATARLHIWLGRSLSTTAPVVSGGNVGSEDVYIQGYEFQTVNVGTLITDVIENGSAGAVTNAMTSSGAVGIIGSATSLGSDRRYVCIIGCDDDASLGNISGDNPAIIDFPAGSFFSASGTDGGVALFHAAMAVAGTQTGGSGTSTPSAGWGHVTFALIGTTVDAAVPRQPAINHASTAVLMRAARKAWHRRRSGIFVPDLWLPEGAKV